MLTPSPLILPSDSTRGPLILRDGKAASVAGPPTFPSQLPIIQMPIVNADADHAAVDIWSDGSSKGKTIDLWGLDLRGSATRNVVDVAGAIERVTCRYCRITGDVSAQSGNDANGAIGELGYERCIQVGARGQAQMLKRVGRLVAHDLAIVGTAAVGDPGGCHDIYFDRRHVCYADLDGYVAADSMGVREYVGSIRNAYAQGQANPWCMRGNASLVNAVFTDANRCNLNVYTTDYGEVRGCSFAGDVNVNCGSNLEMEDCTIGGSLILHGTPAPNGEGTDQDQKYRFRNVRAARVVLEPGPTVNGVPGPMASLDDPNIWHRNMGNDFACTSLPPLHPSTTAAAWSGLDPRGQVPTAAQLGAAARGATA